MPKPISRVFAFKTQEIDLFLVLGFLEPVIRRVLKGVLPVYSEAP